MEGGRQRLGFGWCVIVRRSEGGKAGEHTKKLGERLIKKRAHHTANG